MELITKAKMENNKRMPSPKWFIDFKKEVKDAFKDLPDVRVIKGYKSTVAKSGFRVEIIHQHHICAIISYGVFTKDAFSIFKFYKTDDGLVDERGLSKEELLVSLDKYAKTIKLSFLA